MNEIQAFQNKLETLAPKLQQVYTGESGVNTLIRHTIANLNKNPKLMLCTKQSLYSAVMDAAKSGLNPDGREGVIKPYGKTATFEPMYHGLAKRSGWAHYKAFVVREKDEFEYEDTSDGPSYRFKKSLGDRGAFLAGVCWSIHNDGFKSMTVTNADVIEAIEKKAMQKNPVWKTSREAMWIKTVVKQHAKYQIHDDLSVLDELDEIEGEELDVTPKKSRLDILKEQASETVDTATGELICQE